MNVLKPVGKIYQWAYQPWFLPISPIVNGQWVNAYQWDH